MRKGDKNSPRTSTCEDFLASTIAISGVRCYTVIIIMENHGIVFLNFCGNPEVNSVGQANSQSLLADKCTDDNCCEWQENCKSIVKLVADCKAVTFLSYLGLVRLFHLL